MSQSHCPGSSSLTGPSESKTSVQVECHDVGKTKALTEEVINGAIRPLCFRIKLFGVPDPAALVRNGNIREVVAQYSLVEADDEL
jgi:hypothetical protein